MEEEAPVAVREVAVRVAEATAAVMVEEARGVEARAVVAPARARAEARAERLVRAVRAERAERAERMVAGRAGSEAIRDAPPPCS